MEPSYWSSILSGRQLSRRRLVAACGGAGFGALALSLIGCGSSSSSKATATDSSKLLGKAVDTTQSAIARGTWPDYMPEDIVNMDPLLNNATPTFPQLQPVYSTLLKAGFAVGSLPGSEAITGDAAQSWEFSPDATQITLKLRPQRFDPRPPTNGRLTTSADVRWSWDKYAASGVSAGDLANSRSKDAPIIGIETPDSQTVIFKMAYPYANIIEQLAISQNFYVEPADETFNFKADARGSGPYMVDSFRPSQGIVYKRNPDWYDKPRPYFDTINRTLISDYATGLAQFAAKSIWAYPDIRPEDVLRTKRDNMSMLMLANPAPEANASFLNFSKRDDSVFKDVRVRRAAAMMLDRELLIDTFYNVPQFRDAGLPVTSYWNSHIAAGLSEWVDPRSKDLGEGAQYFQHDIANAKKLVQAAGYKEPVATTLGCFTDNAQLEVKRNQTMLPMFNDGGVFKMDFDPLIYNTTWRNARASAGMGFTGMVWHRAAILSADVILTQKYTPNGRNAVSTNPTPVVTDLVFKQKGEIDPHKRTAIIQQIQKQLALDWPDISWAGSSPGFTLRWPWLANHGVFTEGNGASSKVFAYYWYDKSKQA